MLTMTGVGASYGAVRSLTSLDLVVEEGEFVALLGANGAGKTTTLKVASGVVPASSGRLTFLGEDITSVAAWKRVGRGLGHVPEGRQVFPDQSVQENLLLGGFPLRRRHSELDTRLAEMYDLFPRLHERRDQLAGTLSGGEAQMLAVARALMSGPRLLMLDEPSLGLAPRKVAELFGYLRRLHRERGLSILLVEQQARTALRLADRAYVLDRGRLVLEGPAEVLLQDDRMQAAYFGGGLTA